MSFGQETALVCDAIQSARAGGVSPRDIRLFFDVMAKSPLAARQVAAFARTVPYLQTTHVSGNEWSGKPFIWSVQACDATINLSKKEQGYLDGKVFTAVDVHMAWVPLQSSLLGTVDALDPEFFRQPTLEEFLLFNYEASHSTPRGREADTFISPVIEELGDDGYLHSFVITHGMHEGIYVRTHMVGGKKATTDLNTGNIAERIYVPMVRTHYFQEVRRGTY